MFTLSREPELIDPIVSAPSATEGACITVSVVSHGHDAMLRALSRQLAATHGGRITHWIVTHNLPSEPIEVPVEGWPFRVTELFNRAPAGFGANHNRAFAHCDSPWFCVLNPDVDLPGPELWEALLAETGRPATGLVYPVLLNPDGSRQDNEREAVTPAALLRRRVLGRPEARVDWISAAFWLVSARVFRRLGGFDERFFMYCEDTNFCLRMQLAGFVFRRAEVEVVHEARRGSGRDGRHFGWHVRSLLRLWTDPVLWRYLAWRHG